MSQYPDIDDSGWIDQLHKNVPEAFNRLFRQYQPSLVFFANRLLIGADPMDAEEVVQDVFLKLHGRLTNFQSLTHIKSFLYLVTKNACLDRLAKDRVRKGRFEAFVATFDESEEAILTQITYAELMREINEAVAQLPERCRAIMQQFLEEGKNAQEIAKEMNISVSTVNNQKSRAISILRKRLSDMGMLVLLAALF